MNFFIPYCECNEAQQELIELVKSISNEHWCAGWLNDIERIVWDTYVAGYGDYYSKWLTNSENFHDVSERVIELHKKTRGWVAYESGPEGRGEGFVSLFEVTVLPQPQA